MVSRGLEGENTSAFPFPGHLCSTRYTIFQAFLFEGKCQPPAYTHTTFLYSCAPPLPPHTTLVDVQIKIHFYLGVGELKLKRCG